MSETLTQILTPIAAGLVVVLLAVLNAAGAMIIRHFNSKYVDDKRTAARQDLRSAGIDAATVQQQIATGDVGNAEKKRAATDGAKASLGEPRMAEISAVLGEKSTAATLSDSIEIGVLSTKAPVVQDTVSTVSVADAGGTVTTTTSTHPPATIP